MIVRPATQRPVKLAIGFGDRQVIDACETPMHQTIRRELPVLVSIAAKPVSAVVMPFIGVANGDAVLGKRPELFDQPVIELFLSLSI